MTPTTSIVFGVAEVFVGLGALTWPHGFDLESIELHRGMVEAGGLSRHAA